LWATFEESTEEEITATIATIGEEPERMEEEPA